MGQILGLVGSGVSAIGTIAGGNAAKTASQYQNNAALFTAAQYEQKADESRAASQRTAEEKRLEGRLVQSSALARAAASGGSATDPTALHIGSEIAGRSEYLALTERYKGENQARGYEDAAMAARYSGQAALAYGDAAQKASMFSAAGTLIGAAGSAFSGASGGGGGAGKLPTSTPTQSPLALNPMLYNKLPYG